MVAPSYAVPFTSQVIVTGTTASCVTAYCFVSPSIADSGPVMEITGVGYLDTVTDLAAVPAEFG